MTSLALFATLLLSAQGFQMPLLRPALAVRPGLVAMSGAEDTAPQQPAEKVKVTIRQKKQTGAVAPAPASKGWVFMVVQFEHVKESLSTFLKFWLMGGCGAVGWSGTGELEAKHTSGTEASIVVDVERATVTLRSTSDDSYNTKRQLGRYATQLLDQLDELAKTEEAAESDRLCHPPAAVDSARTVVIVQLASAAAPPPS